MAFILLHAQTSMLFLCTLFELPNSILKSPGKESHTLKKKINSSDLEILISFGNGIAAREDLQNITFFLSPSNNSRWFPSPFRQKYTWNSGIPLNRSSIFPQIWFYLRDSTPFTLLGTEMWKIHGFGPSSLRSQWRHPSVVPCWSAGCWWRCQWRRLGDNGPMA